MSNTKESNTMNKYVVYAAGRCFPILSDILKSCHNYEQIVNGGVDFSPSQMVILIYGAKSDMG